MDSRGNLESQAKVREFENKWLWRESSESLLILFKKVKDVHSHEIV